MVDQKKFLTAFNRTMQFEGEYVHGEDPFIAETYKGIDRNHNSAWSGWQIIDDYKSATVGSTITEFNAILRADTILQTMVQIFYEENYWKPMLCDVIASKVLTNVLFDTAVNLGRRKASMILQRAIGLFLSESEVIEIDGVIGGGTVAVLGGLSDRQQQIACAVEILRGNHYITLAESGKKYRRFIGGWLNRIGFND